MSLYNRAIELAESGEYSRTAEIESALIKEYDVKEVHRQFNDLSFKKMIGDMIRESEQQE